jgi:branched-chain amino acid transport system permease protein
VIAQALGGLVPGGAYAALAVCLVLMYQMLGVLNFAQSAMGGLGACASLFFINTLGWATLPATLGALVCGLLLGIIFGAVMSRFFLETSVETRTTVTIAFLVGLIAIGNRILTGGTYTFPDIGGGHSVTLFGTGVPIGALIEAVGALVLALAIQAFLRGTNVGAQLRAVSERPVTAQLLGIRVRRLTVAVWAFAGLLSTLAVLFVLPTTTASFPTLADLVAFALGAALLGLLRNLFVAALGGILIGMLQSVVQPTAIGRYTQAVPFVVIALVMFWWRRADVWSEAR